MVDQIFKILLEGDEVTWQELLTNLVKEEKMDPWDLDVSLLAKKYIEMVKKMKELDFRISGKVVLAAAILLKLKSNRLLGEEIDELDRLMNPQDDDIEGFYDELEIERLKERPPNDSQPLVPRTPQPRKRKVSIYDLVTALNKALEVKERRTLRNLPVTDIQHPRKTIDIHEFMTGLFGRLMGVFNRGKGKIEFNEVLRNKTREEKFYTFISALHLANIDQREIDLHQDEPFGRITITKGDPSKAIKVAKEEAENPEDAEDAEFEDADEAEKQE